MDNSARYRAGRSMALWLAIPLATAFLASVPGAGSSHHFAKLFDDRNPITLTVDDVVVNEGEAAATFTITRNGKTKDDVTFDIATSGVEATEDVDYTGRTATLSIPDGGKSATETFTVQIGADAIDEETETFLVTLTNPRGAKLLKGTGTGTIIDDDTAGINVDQHDGIFVLEGGAADALSIALQSEPSADVVLTVITMTDQLTVTPSEVTFLPQTWDVPQHISVAAIPDGIDEDDPHMSPISFTIGSADPSYSEILVTDVPATIGDADALLVTIDGPTAGAPGQPASFVALVNAGGSGAITYDWTAFQQGNPIAAGIQSTFQFTPATGGPFIVQAIVGDEQGQNPATFLQFTALSDLEGSGLVADIVWLANQAITMGCNPPLNDMFCPTDAVTRGQMAALLVRFLGLSDDGGGNTFTDDDNSIFETDIAKLATAGITTGCNPPANTQFCPDAPVTREQMAAFLVRAIGLTDDGGGNTFTDDNSSIFETDIAKLATAGITTGCNPPANDEFCPEAPVTREQMAAFIHRASLVE